MLPGADAHFRARPRPAAPLQVCSFLREHVEYGDEIITMVQDALHGSFCYYHATFGRRVLKCRRPCCWPRETPGAGIKELSFLP